MPEHAYSVGVMRRGSARRDQPGAASALMLAALCVVALALVWVVAALVPAAHVRDAVALHDFTLLDGSHIAAAFTLTVGVALLISAWHLPSDVLGGYFMAVLWMALAVAALRASEWRWPSHAALLQVTQRRAPET